MDTESRLSALEARMYRLEALVASQAQEAEDRENASKQLVTESYNEAYTQIMQKINDEIAPAINQAMNAVRYKLDDGDGYVDDYRRAYEEMVRTEEDVKAITFGEKTDARIITPHVRTFFGDDD